LHVAPSGARGNSGLQVDGPSLSQENSMMSTELAAGVRAEPNRAGASAQPFELARAMRPDVPITAFAVPNEPKPGRTPHEAAPLWRANEPATPENPNEPEAVQIPRV
jgi:hypothetical protein